jgi:uncharacterized lipoprotein
MFRKTGVGAVAALSIVALAGCGEKTLKTSQIEDQLKSQAGAAVKTVSCPDDVKAEKGGTFNCEVTLASGQKGQVKVTQTDDNGNVHVEAVKPSK